MLLYHKVNITYSTVEIKTHINYLIDDYKAICLALISTANRPVSYTHLTLPTIYSV